MKVILELAEPLTDIELRRLPLLLRDAFGEFQTHRGVLFNDERDDAGVRKYFSDRYGSDPLQLYSDKWRNDKIQEIKERCAQAKKLHDSEIEVQQ